MNLRKYLELCKKEYYAGNPIISDTQYDNLEDICSEDLTVGTNKGRCRHWNKMYSLQKYYTDEDYPSDTGYIMTPKLDGASLSIRYINCYIDSIVTRGDGTYGEDVSHLICSDVVRKLKIPAYIRRLGAIQVTGELVAPKSIMNARNYAAGALNLKTVEDFLNKEVEFIAYDMQETQFETYVGTVYYLRDEGFNTVYTSNNLAKYPQDGYVYRLEINKDYNELGYTNKHPRGAFALKERSKGVKTILLRVDWETGKSGKVTPVAILDAVDIDGASVSRATLNNPGFIKALDLHIGDAVMVERAGGIIPRIIKKAE